MARIVIVEDDELVRLTLARIVEHGGHEPLTVESGYGVLDELAQLDFDLVITDIAMAGVDGLGVIRWTQTNRPGVPVLAVSGGSALLDTGVALRLCLAMGVSGAVAKPFRARELLAQIGALLGTAERPADVALNEVVVERSLRIS